MNTNGIGTTPNSKANPFVEGSALQQEAESVVNAFLMNEANTKSMLHGINTDQLDSGTMSPIAAPGKIEDLPSPTGAYGQMQVTPATTVVTYRFRYHFNNLKYVVPNINFNFPL